ncbi:hypothetical protein C6I20_04565 [Aeromicrobium sp. A1-2]|nr:hypothetical protein C6I20_04565 [Aeromicrobium sp. A1-2]
MQAVFSNQTEANRAAWATGDITTGQAGIVARAVAELPDGIGAEERADGQQILLGRATILATDDLRHARLLVGRFAS